MFGDFGAHFGGDLFGAAAALAFELDGDIAAIGFGDGGEAELQAGAAGGAFDFGRLAQDFFDGGDYAVGIF